MHLLLIIMFKFILYHPDFGNRTIIDPLGWDGHTKIVKRDMNWHGMFFEYTSALKFVKDGMGLVQYVYEKYGPEEELKITIQRKNKVTREWRTEYTGKVNLASYDIGPTWVACNLEQTGFLQKVKNRQDVKVDTSSLVSKGGRAIPAFSDEDFSLALHPKVVPKEFQWEPPTNVPGGEFVYDEPVSGQELFCIWELENILLDEIEQRVNPPAQMRPENPVDELIFLFQVKEGGDYVFDINISFSFQIAKTGSPGFTADWSATSYLVIGKPTGYTTITMGPTSAAANANFTDAHSYSGTHTLAVGDEIYLFTKVAATYAGVGTGVSVRQRKFTDFTVNIVANTLVPGTTAKTKLIHEVWTRVVQSISDQPAACFKSDYYGRTDSEPITYGADGAGSLRAITNGKLVRGIDANVFASLKELYDTCRAIDGVGMGIERVDGVERLRVEPLSHFYKPRRMMQLTNIRDIKKHFAEELVFSDMNVGYQKWSNNGKMINNLDEFNARREWTLPITQLKNTLTLLSPYIASGYSLEFTRRDTKSLTTDNENDDLNFIIQLRRDGVLVTDKDEDFSSVTGVVSPETAYNLKLSPLRMIARNGALIRSGVEKYASKHINFDFGDGNKGMLSVEPASFDSLNENPGMDEDGNILISKLARPLWLPEIYEFSAKLTEAQLEALNTTDPDASENIFGFIEFAADDHTFKRGYVYDAQVQAKTKQVKFQLLRANF